MKINIPLTIQVDGVKRSTHNSLGQLIHQTGQGIINFWRWFGDSRAIDAHGRPLVLYRGSTNDEVVPSDRTYLSVCPNVAGSHAITYEHIQNMFADKRGLQITKPTFPNISAFYVKTNLLYKNPVTQRLEDAADIIANGTGGKLEVIVKDANALKSATGNNGKFGPHNSITSKS